jgi:hypothetical protein
LDADLPIECDDEYWENDDPARAFKQPLGKPSKVTFFIEQIKLMGIVSFALRTIVSSLNGDIRLVQILTVLWPVLHQ